MGIPLNDNRRTHKQGKHISLIGLPMDLGSGRRGVDMGPSAIRCAGLQQRLESIGCRVTDCGDLRMKGTRRASGDPKLKFLPQIAQASRQLCEKVDRELGKGRFPLVLGGDHSIAMGTLAGVSRRYAKLGVIWYDAHGDLNTADTTPSGNIHGMPLAAALGFGHPQLTGIGGEQPKVEPGHVVLIGSRSLDAGERELMKRLGIRAITMHDIDRYGMAEMMSEALAIAGTGTDGIHLSLDLDALDPQDAPGVGTPVPGGLTLRESLLAMELLAASGSVVSAELVEVNPTLDTVNKTAKVAVELAAALLGEKIN